MPIATLWSDSLSCTSPWYASNHRSVTTRLSFLLSCKISSNRWRSYRRRAALRSSSRTGFSVGMERRSDSPGAELGEPLWQLNLIRSQNATTLHCCAPSRHLRLRPVRAPASQRPCLSDYLMASHSSKCSTESTCLSACSPPNYPRIQLLDLDRYFVASTAGRSSRCSHTYCESPSLPAQSMADGCSLKCPLEGM